MSKEEISEQADKKRNHERESKNAHVGIVTGGRLNKEIAKDRNTI